MKIISVNEDAYIMAGKPRRNRASVRTIVIGLRLTQTEHQVLLKVLERENRRRVRPTKSDREGLPTWTPADLLREWIARAARARSAWDPLA